MRFKNKTALITGGGTGIGAAVARRIRLEGGNVALVGRRPDPLHAVAEEIGAAVVVADAADGASMKAAALAVAEQFGSLD
ncbi:SDR family NAD(P)-dependent oxidoreductase, partial [Rhizobium ruizarguesonis]